MTKFFESPHKAALDKFEKQIEKGQITSAIADIERYLEELPFISVARYALQDARDRNWIFLAAKLGDYAVVSWLEKHNLGSMEQRNEQGQSPYDIAEIYGQSDFVRHQARRDPEETVHINFTRPSIFIGIEDELLPRRQAPVEIDPMADYWAKEGGCIEIAFHDIASLEKAITRLTTEDDEVERRITALEVDEQTADLAGIDTTAGIMAAVLEDHLACGVTESEDNTVLTVSTEPDETHYDEIPLDEDGELGMTPPQASNIELISHIVPLSSRQLVQAAANRLATGLEVAADLADCASPKVGVLLESLAADVSRAAERVCNQQMS